jgi:hypothetical protein
MVPPSGEAMPSDAGPTIARGGHGPAPVAALAAGLLVAQQVAAKVVRDAFFLSQFPVSALPLAVGTGAVLSLLAVAVLSRGMARLPPARLLPAMLWSSAVLLVAEWALSLVAPRPAAVAVYLHVALFGAAVVSSFWAMVNERFDPHTARQAMGQIGSGASVGGVLGAAATWRLSTLVPVSALLLAIAALLAASAMATRRLGRTERAEPGASDDSAAALDTAAEVVAGWRVLAAMPYLRSLAGLVALCALLEAVLDYAFSAAAVARFGRGEGLVAFFAAFHTTTGVLALVVQAALVRWLLARVGLAGTLTVHSMGVAALAAVTAAVPRMGTVVVLRAAEAVLRHSTFRSAYELFYTPLPPHRKRPAKPLVDVGADRVGTLAGSIATAAVVALAGRYTSSVLVLMALAAALGMVALAWRLHRGYVSALGDSLRAGVVRVETSEVVDATTLHTVQDFRPARPAAAAAAVEVAGPLAPLIDKGRAREDDLRSGDLARIRAVLAEAVLDPALVAIAMPLLGRDDLFGEVVLAFRRAAPRCTGQLIDVLLDPATAPVVRRRIPRVLASVTTQRAADGLLAGLECERLDVRYRSAQALVRLRQRATVRLPADALFALAAREIDGLAAGGGARLDHVFALLSLALDGEPMAIALRALRGSDASLRGTALEYLDHVLPAAIRAALWPRLGTTAVETASRRTVDEVRGELLASSWHATVGERRTRNSAAG